MDIKSKILSQIETKKAKAKNGKLIKICPEDSLEIPFQDLKKKLGQSLTDTQQNISIVLEGPGGTGKTMTLRKCFDQLKETGTFHQIWLNGFIQNTDVSALKEIMRQLRIVTDESEENQNFGNTQEYILNILKNEKKSRKPVFIILDDFDEFTNRPKQTLLYFLFDLQQSVNFQICIISITTRIDSFSLLEKRVRSRFSDYKIRFPMIIGDKEVLKKVCLNLLTINNPTKKDEKKYNKTVYETLEDKTVLENINILSNFSTSTPRKILNILIYMVINLDDTKLVLTPAIFNNAVKNQGTNPERLKILHDLNMTQLILVCAMVRLRIFKNQTTYTFMTVLNDIYENTIVRKHHNENDDTHGEMLERLIQMGLVVPMPRQKQTLDRYKKIYLALDATRIKRYIKENMMNKLPFWVASYLGFGISG